MALRPTMADLLDRVHIFLVHADPTLAAAIKDALLITGPLAHAGAVWRVDGGRVDVNYRWEWDPVTRLMSDAKIAADLGIPRAADTPIPA